MKRMNIILVVLISLLCGCSHASDEPVQVAILSMESISTGHIFEIMSNRTVNYIHAYVLALYVDKDADGTLSGRVTDENYINKIYETQTFELSAEEYEMLIDVIARLKQYEPDEKFDFGFSGGEWVQASVGGRFYVTSSTNYHATLPEFSSDFKLYVHKPELLEIVSLLVEIFPIEDTAGYFTIG